MIRPYTGNRTGVATGVHPQLALLSELLLDSYPALWNNGDFGVRNMRGKTSLSVHATGRAVDISWRNMGDGKRGLPKGGRKQAVAAMEWLRTHGDELGIELIIDYFPKPYGRAASCLRDMAWKAYNTHAVSGAPGGDWCHLEVDGRKSPLEITKVFDEYPPILPV